MPNHKDRLPFSQNSEPVPTLIIPTAGETLAAMSVDQKAPIPRQSGLVTANHDNGQIITIADGVPVLNLSVPMALELMARLASACKDAIKGRP